MQSKLIINQQALFTVPVNTGYRLRSKSFMESKQKIQTTSMTMDR